MPSGTESKGYIYATEIVVLGNYLTFISRMPSGTASKGEEIYTTELVVLGIYLTFVSRMLSGTGSKGDM